MIKVFSPPTSCEKPITSYTDHYAIDYYPKAGILELSILLRDPETTRWFRGARIILTQGELQRHPDAFQLLKKAVLELGMSEEQRNAINALKKRVAELTEEA